MPQGVSEKLQGTFCWLKSISMDHGKRARGDPSSQSSTPAKQPSKKKRVLSPYTSSAKRVLSPYTSSAKKRFPFSDSSEADPPVVKSRTMVRSVVCTQKLLAVHK